MADPNSPLVIRSYDLARVTSGTYNYTGNLQQPGQSGPETGCVGCSSGAARPQGQDLQGNPVRLTIPVSPVSAWRPRQAK
jgi:hypothetical protein